MGKVIGIDLGTTNSAAAVHIGGKATLIQAVEGPVHGGGKAFPSIVSITKDGRILIGEPARRQMISNPEGTVIGFKRKMGTDFKYSIHGKEYTPQQITAYILQKIKKDAESFLGDKIDKAVITVPAYFNDNQRQATKDAANIADMVVLRILNEPTAASLTYGLDRLEEDIKIMVFDLGGGTLDVTILEFGHGVFQVKSVAGDTQLGGHDMDNALVDYALSEFRNQSVHEVTNDKAAMMRISEAVEKAKIELSFVEDTEINLPFIAYDPSTGPINLLITLTRGKLEEILQPIVERCKGPVTQALADARFSQKDIDKVILIGGPTRMPFVRQFIRTITGKEPEHSVNPTDTVAVGASILGAIISKQDVTSHAIQLIDVIPLTLGVETINGKREAIIQRNSMIPTKKSKLFTTTVDNQPIVTINVVQGENPMVKDCVSLGKFDLGISPAPKGVPQIEVSFEIDVNGTLNVTAKDIVTLRESKVTINTKNRLSNEEIEEMKSQL
jgi:molecular chaperone DnaK